MHIELVFDLLGDAFGFVFAQCLREQRLGVVQANVVARGRELVATLMLEIRNLMVFYENALAVNRFSETWGSFNPFAVPDGVKPPSALDLIPDD